MTLEELRAGVDGIKEQLSGISKEEQQIIRRRSGLVYELRKLQAQCSHPQEERLYNAVLAGPNGFECGVCCLFVRIF